MRTLFGFVVSALLAVVAGSGGEVALESVDATATTMVVTTTPSRTAHVVTPIRREPATGCGEPRSVNTGS